MYPQFGPEPMMAPQPPPPKPAAASHRRRRAVLAAGVSVIAVAATLVGVEIGSHTSATVAGSGSITGGASFGLPNSGTSGGSASGGEGSGGFPGGFGSSGSGSGSTGSGSGSTGSGSTPQQDSQASATSAQQVGIVDIDTVLGYEDAAAAGTGMVLTSSGEILTNNHVVDGATSIKVTIVSTGSTYTATVVGTDPTDDVAVIQLKNASGLQTAKVGNSSPVSVGAAVTGVGNAGGVGGVPSAAKGTVQALNQTITASDEDGSNPETLHGLIQTNAPIQAGDSGGPLYNSSGSIVGMDTAAQTSGSGGVADAAATASTAYAIPINSALGIAAEIESGQASSTVHIGYPPFLGVSVGTDSGSGAAIVSALQNGPAANAGITGGDLITSVGGKSVTSGTGLKSALADYQPGQRVKIGWTDTSGQHHSATITLVTGPAD